jgi:transposase-like protein
VAGFQKTEHPEDTLTFPHTQLSVISRQCLEKDPKDLFTFYDFPAEHWGHLRTTNPIESSFATVRHRHRQTKGNGSRQATLAMVHKLATEVQNHWRKLNGYELLTKVIGGVRFEDGVEVAA